ncbi:MAG: RecX family transcriptional regulator [Bacteroidetes bacterium]|nr:RecX family transcriptional regulator [Bacteroidota bacterium]MCY4225788.1 RecX family transcriptional regulator [Bacteroidota bacterium]
MKPLKNSSVKPGIITALKSQANPSRTSIFIDGQFAVGVWTDIVLKERLYVGQSLHENDLNALLEVEQIQRVRSTALQYLAYAPRTEVQLRERLHQKGFSTQTIEAVIQELIELGYIDDQTYAMDYAKARFEHKGYGPSRIRRELIHDGVCEAFVNEAITISVPAEAVTQQAERIARQFKDRVNGTLPERKKKLIGYLTRRGYGYSLSNELVQNLLE